MPTSDSPGSGLHTEGKAIRKRSLKDTETWSMRSKPGLNERSPLDIPTGCCCEQITYRLPAWLKPRKQAFSAYDTLAFSKRSCVLVALLASPTFLGLRLSLPWSIITKRINTPCYGLSQHRGIDVARISSSHHAWSPLKSEW